MLPVCALRPHQCIETTALIAHQLCVRGGHAHHNGSQAVTASKRRTNNNGAGRTRVADWLRGLWRVRLGGAAGRRAVGRRRAADGARDALRTRDVALQAVGQRRAGPPGAREAVVHALADHVHDALVHVALQLAEALFAYEDGDAWLASHTQEVKAGLGPPVTQARISATELSCKSV